jgi:hypothetical protein
VCASFQRQGAHTSTHPFTLPARIPLTKYRCRAKNTMSGMKDCTKAHAARMCSSRANSPASDAMSTVAGSAWAFELIMVRAIR